jgi:hypothetical protein
MSDKRRTDSTLQVLHALLADPTRERYGLELSKSSGIAHGTMYGILVRLEDWGSGARRDRCSPGAGRLAAGLLADSPMTTTGPHCVIDDARESSWARAGSAGPCATTT